MKTKFKEFRLADVSTAHVTRSDRALLLDPDCPNVYGVHHEGCGSLVYTTSSRQDYLRGCGFSEAFINIYQDADEQGIGYIMFDCNGHVYPDLPKYDE